ncbi:hypothetical protein FRC09_009909 [Ceratobasidium sp. 395]|nr:hypothetical protein FRC09_009909 [Ceratobasidium sp. 395]
MQAAVPFEDQCPHVLELPISKPLYEVENPEHFLKASLSLLDAIHNLYVKGKILHGDVSVNNMMVRAERPWEGILLDLDLARDEHINRQGSTLVHRTGTLPFMALDLLHDQDDYPHYHRHDLESLVYVLVWIAGNYEDGSMVQSPLFNEWCESNWSTARLNKTCFLLFDPDYWHFCPTPPYEFLDNLLLQLRMILGQAHISARFEFHSMNIRPPNDPPPVDEGYVESSSGQRRNRQTSADTSMPRAVLKLPEDLPRFNYDILRSKLKATLENLGSPV